MTPFQDKIFRHLWRNRPALLGLVWIVLSVFLAIFGYILAPDSSPDADFQIPEIALQSPGFQVDLLPLPAAISDENPNFFKRNMLGTPVRFRLIPVENYHFTADSIIFQRFGSSSREVLHRLHLYFSVRDSIQKRGHEFSFLDETGTPQIINESEFALFEPVKVESRTFWLGTDKYGRCIFSRLLLGFRISLFVGLLAVAISLLLGLSLGLIAGYFGGRVDQLVMLLINTVWSIPTLLLVFAIVLALGRGIGIIFIAVGLTIWVEVARMVRGQTMVLREMQFIEAAKSMGFGTRRILWQHILPNLMGPVLVLSAVNFATAILLESGLSFLGFGVQPPSPSWGAMLNENYGYAISGKPLLALAPALVIALSVLAFNLVGNALRDAFDVKGER